MTILQTIKSVSELLLPLNSTSATLAEAGGKGMNLSVLARAGFAVPPGFIVTTAAYHAFVADNRIQARLLELARSISPDDPAALDAASESIRTLFKDGTLSATLAETLAAAYDRLPASDSQTPAVAVRSSATAEDLPGLSFAGQQDTYLNIVGHEALREAVKACWGSLWTARALAYRTRNGIAPDAVALAVVVQMLIPSEVSGVLFTANPLTGNRDETVIDATFGLGEAIVSGQVEPDHYVVNTQAQHIESRKLGAKALAILPRSDGGTRTSTEAHAQQQALPDAQIIDLTRTGAQVAAHFGSPQDIEWAWAGGRMYLLQSRPITTLYPVPDALLRSPKLRVLFSLNSLQGVPEPLTPLGQELFQQLASGILRRAGVRRAANDFVISAGERLYLDLTDVLASKRGRKLIVDGLLANADPGARQAVQSVFASGRGPTGSGVKPSSVLRLLRMLSPILVQIPLTLARPDARRKHAIQKLERQRDELQQAMQQATTLQQRIAVWDEKVPRILANVVFAIMPVLVPGFLPIGLADNLLTRWAGAEPGSVRRLLRGLPYNPTTEMDLQLWATAQAIRADPAARAKFAAEPAEGLASAYERGQLPPAAQAAMRSFLDRYGMRAVAEIDIGRPRWREDPLALIQNVRSYLQIEDAAAAPDRVFERATAEAERLVASDVADARQRSGRVRAHLLGALLRRLRLLAGMREMPKFAMIQQFDVLRTALLVSGEELVTQRKLTRADDIFFVPWQTLREVAHGTNTDLKSVVDRQRTVYAAEMTRRQMPRILLSNGEAFYAGLSEAGSNDLVGDGVSPGTVEGIVHVVIDPRGVRLAPGEILVCPATDPGWTPLFLSAGGLVMELGGMMTHGSVVAREYGIPAVVGVHEATTRLKSGQRVRVDGSVGRVVLLEDQGKEGNASVQV